MGPWEKPPIKKPKPLRKDKKTTHQQCGLVVCLHQRGRQLHCENIELGDQYARLEVKNKQQADRIAELEKLCKDLAKANESLMKL